MNASSAERDRKSTRLNSSHLGISYAVFCLIKKKVAYAKMGPLALLWADSAGVPSKRSRTLRSSTRYPRNVLHANSVLGLSPLFFFVNDTTTTEIYTLSLHDALPISGGASPPIPRASSTWASWGLSNRGPRDRKSTRLNSSHLGISYAVFCLKKK